MKRIKFNFKSLVIIPWMLFVLYQVGFLEERYVSTSQIIVKQPDSASTMDPSMALLSGLGVKPTNEDIQLVQFYITSYDMFNKLNSDLDLVDHYKAEGWSSITRFYEASNKEQVFDVYKKYVTAKIDEGATALTIESQSFNPDYSEKLNRKIIKYAEEYINSIGHQLARAQIDFIDNEHKLIENRLINKQHELNVFQEENGLLDAEAEGLAMQKITYSLEAKLTQAEIELSSLKNQMSEESLIVKSKQMETEAIREQLSFERNKLSGNDKTAILNKFAHLKLELELILRAYTSSQISMEKSRVEAYRQLKHLITIQNPTLPISNKYPEVTYNVSLAFVVLLMLFAIGKIVFATFKELS